MIRAALIAIMALATTALSAQVDSTQKVVQFSGIVVTGDSLSPVPLTTVYRLRDNRGTISDQFGFFSLPAFAGDTIRFTNVGYTLADYVIPTQIEERRLSVVQFVRRDTVLIETARVYPWPSTKEKFREEFLALTVENENTLAQKNLESVLIYDRMIEMGADGSENYKIAMRQQAERLSFQGSVPTISLMNPFAWAQFIKAWRNGDFKRQ
jgi:hypothetical protein